MQPNEMLSKLADSGAVLPGDIPLEHQVAGWIVKNWGVSTAIIIFILALVYLMKYWVPSINKRLKGLEDKSHTQEITKLDAKDFVRKNEIYAEDGTARYQHTQACRDMQKNCQGTICVKVDEVKSVLSERLISLEEQMEKMDKARDDTRNEIKNIIEKVHEQQKDVVKIGTQVKVILNESNQKQIKAIVKAVAKEINGGEK